MKVLLPAIVATLAIAHAASAQQSATPGDHAEMGTVPALPAICPIDASDSGSMMPMEHDGAPQDDLMQSTMALTASMMHAMSASDPDVAFACAMIPHHQSAIEMAKAELRDGDAEPMRAMAQAVIDAQEREIAELTSWLEGQSN